MSVTFKITFHFFNKFNYERCLTSNFRNEQKRMRIDETLKKNNVPLCVLAIIAVRTQQLH